MRTWFLVVCLFVMSACTTRGAYDTVQGYNKNECAQFQLEQYDECMARVNKSFDEYERERDGVKSH